MADEVSKQRGAATLTDEDGVSEKGRDVGRRGMISLLGISAAGAVALTAGCYRRARVVAVAGGTDGDSGPCADPAGGGRGVTGVTDGDQGQYGCTDPVNRGRGAQGQQQQVV